MINPFAEMVAPQISEGEEIEGAFDCQRCFVTVNKALYFDEERLLVWLCPDKHKSLIEDFHLD